MRGALFAMVVLTAVPRPPHDALAAAAIAAPLAPTGHYRLDRDHASVVAKVRYLGVLQYTVRFSRIDGRYDVDPAHPREPRLSVAIDARSFDDVGDPGSRRVVSEILDADRHPRVTFKSSAVRPNSADPAALTGDLTFRGVTKPVILQVTTIRTPHAADGDRSLAYCATTVIRRSDFGSRSWPATVGDKVRLVINAQFVRE